MPTATPFSNLITFSRGSNATVTGSNGLIQWAPANLLTNSENFDAGAWVKAGVTVYPNQDFGNGTLGSELVTNGTFGSGTTGWSRGFNSVDGTFTATGGVATYTVGAGDGSFPRMVTAISGLTVGRFYRISFDEVSATGTGDRYAVWTSDPTGIGGVTLNQVVVAGWSSETKTYYYPATATTMYVAIGLGNAAVGSTLSVDNVSVKETTPAAATAPDGTQTADNVIATASASATRAVYQNFTSAAGTTYTASVYAKAAGYSLFAIQEIGGGRFGASFNLVAQTTASLGGAGFVSSSITSVGNGWFRCSVVWTGLAASNAITFVGYPAGASINAAGATYAGDGTSGVLIWGAQLELGSTATTYNPTSVKNLLGFSEAFDNAAWTKGNVGIVTGAAANPVNGLFNAQKLMEDTATTSHQTFQVTTVISGTSYTFSVYAKQAVGSRTLTLRCQLTPVNFQGATFDLATGASSQLGTGITASASAVGNGWYRCSITFTASASGGNLCYVNATASGTVTYTGDGNSGIFIYGAQLSDSASLDPYVPTPGAAPSSTAYYGPRFDFDPVTRQPRGILIEEQRTNLFTYSQDFANVAWDPDALTKTSGLPGGLDGTASVGEFSKTSAGVHYPRNTATLLAANTTYTISAWLWHTGTVPTEVRFAYFAGSWVTSSNLAVTTTPTRFTWTVTTGATVPTVGTGLYLNFAPSGGAIRIWGAQAEAGGFATSYIPTIASTVTRSVDVATISGSLFSQWYRQDAGTFVASCSMLALSTATTQEILETDSGSVANAITLRANNTAGQTSSTATTASVSQGFIDISGAAANTLQNVALGVSTNNTAMVRNGGAVGSDATYAVPTGLTRITFGTRTNSGAPLNGHIRSIRYIPARAADFQLQALTT